MKKNKLIILFLLWVSSIPSYTQVVYPVQLNTTILPPHSIYLSDYSAPNLNMWLVNMKYLDFNEPSIEVSMRLTIEGNGVLLKTNPFTSANNSFTLLPGEIKQLAGEDLAVYLDINNLDVAGITKNKLLSNSRLPEGFYEFSIEIFHAETGELLSQKLSQSLWLSLTDPPVINNPICGSRVDVQLPMALNFQWQQANVMSPNTEGVEYQLTLLEILNNNIDPQSAISNGQILEIFKSDWQAENNYLYGLTETPLDEGKRYAFVVQVKELSGRDLFKNSGYSQICWFNYGYLTGGSIVQTFPEDEHGFTKLEQQFFKWDKPDNLIDGQKVRFELTIKEVEDGQTALLAFDNNPTWYTHTSQEVEVFDAWNYELTDKKYKKGHAYVWQVKAFTDDSEIASSDISMFYGPPIVDEFYIGKHRVEVASLASNNLQDLSGTCWVTVYPHDDRYRIKVPFEHFNIQLTGGKPTAIKGSISGNLKEDLEIQIPNVVEPNGIGHLIANQFRLSTTTDLMIKGHLDWELPLLVDSPTETVIQSKDTWVIFNEFQPIANLKLQEMYNVSLLAPFDFQLTLDTSAYFEVKQTNYALHMNGFVEPPTIVNGFIEDISPKYHFIDAKDIFYIKGTPQGDWTHLHPLKNINAHIHPTAYDIDFSSTTSTSSFDDEWMGIAFTKYQLKFTSYAKSGKTLIFDEAVDISFSPLDTAIGYIDRYGLTLNSKLSYLENINTRFNTFPAKIRNVRLEFIRNALSNSSLEGDIQIPFFSATEKYTFTVPMTQDGYLDGYLHESFDDKEIIFNKGKGEQEVTIKILRAVFEKQTHLRCDVSLEWKHFNVKIDYADNLNIWGNYNIGFKTINGNLALSEQVKGDASGYEITATHIGAGRQNNLYGVGFMSTINMGEDAAGPNGVPEINAYSVYRSPLIDENTPLSQSLKQNDYTAFEGNSQVFKTNADGGLEIETSEPRHKTDELMGDIEQSFIEDRTPQKPTPEVFTIEDPSQEDSTQQLTLSDIYELIDVLILLSNEEKAAKLQKIKADIQSIQQSEVAEIYNELKEYGFSIQAFLKSKVDDALQVASSKFKAKVDTINRKIEKRIDSLINPISNGLETLIEKSITVIGDQAFKLIKDDSLGKKAAIRDSIVELAILHTHKEVDRSVRVAVHSNITHRIHNFIDTTITQRVTGFMQEEIGSLGYALIDNSANKDIFGEVIKGAGQLVGSIAEDTWNTVSNTKAEGITNTIKSIGESAYKGIQWDKIAIQVGKDIFKLTMQDQLKALGSRVADSLMNKLVGEKLKKALNGSAVGFAKEAVSQNVKLDFNNLGAKIKEGDVKGIVKFDPSVIVVKTKVAEFTATLDFIKDDPLWGDCFKGKVKAIIKKPTTINANAIYINGKKRTYKYWFLQLQVEDGLRLPLLPGVLDLNGIGGKVFSRMAYNREDDTYYPDSTNRFGAGLMLRCSDASTGGSVTQLEVTCELQIFKDYFEMEIRGGVGVGFASSKPVPVTKGLISGVGYINFSSRTKELVGAFDVKVNACPILFAGGGMGFYVGEKHWRIYIGEEPSPIELKILCSNLLKFEAWFDLSKTKLDLGIRADIEAYARSPWFKVFGTQIRPYVGFEFYFLTRVQMDFQPKVRLREAQLELEVFAGIGCEWKKKKKSGTWNLVAAYFHGLMHYKNTDKEAFIKGELEGKIEIIGIKVGTKMNVKKDLG